VAGDGTGTFVTGAQDGDGQRELNAELVTTGALILISTGVIPATPPAIVASSAAAQTVIYSGSSKADGTYSIEVRGSTTTTYRVRPSCRSSPGRRHHSTKTYTGVDRDDDVGHRIPATGRAAIRSSS
jgi:hypothetical protein